MKHSFYSWAILIVGFIGYGLIVGWVEGDAEKILTKILYTFLYWASIALFAFIYNGIGYNTWSIVRENSDSNSRVLAAIIIGTAFVIGRGF